MKIGLLDEKIGNAMVQACDDIISGKLNDQFPTDPIQGGVGVGVLAQGVDLHPLGGVGAGKLHLGGLLQAGAVGGHVSGGEAGDDALGLRGHHVAPEAAGEIGDPGGGSLGGPDRKSVV